MLNLGKQRGNCQKSKTLFKAPLVTQYSIIFEYFSEIPQHFCCSNFDVTEISVEGNG